MIETGPFYLLVELPAIHKLGLLFEEVKQFAISITNYGLSDKFKPTITLDYDKLNDLMD